MYLLRSKSIIIYPSIKKNKIARKRLNFDIAERILKKFEIRKPAEC